jgi:competence protein ComFC
MVADWKKSLQELFFPITSCVACGQKADNDGLCDACRERIKYAKRCPRCAAFLSDATADCSLCHMHEKLPFSKAIAALPYEGKLRMLLRNYKYYNQPWLSYPFAEMLSVALADYDLLDFVLVPVPLFADKEEKRGYNQAQLLAELLAKKQHLPCLTQCIERVVDTPPLYSLNRRQRIEILAEAFIPGRQSLVGKKILLIDDIFTTGSTCISCSKMLLANGAEEIIVAAVASTKL